MQFLHKLDSMSHESKNKTKGFERAGDKVLQFAPLLLRTFLFHADTRGFWLKNFGERRLEVSKWEFLQGVEKAFLGVKDLRREYFLNQKYRGSSKDDCAEKIARKRTLTQARAILVKKKKTRKVKEKKRLAELKMLEDANGPGLKVDSKGNVIEGSTKRKTRSASKGSDVSKASGRSDGIVRKYLILTRLRIGDIKQLLFQCLFISQQIASSNPNLQKKKTGSTSAPQIDHSVKTELSSSLWVKVRTILHMRVSGVDGVGSARELNRALRKV